MATITTFKVDDYDSITETTKLDWEKWYAEKIAYLTGQGVRLSDGSTVLPDDEVFDKRNMDDNRLFNQDRDDSFQLVEMLGTLLATVQNQNFFNKAK